MNQFIDRKDDKWVCEDERVKLMWLTGYTKNDITKETGEKFHVLLKDGTQKDFEFKWDNFQQVKDWLSNYKK